MPQDRRQKALNLATGVEATPANIGRVARVCGVQEARWAFNQAALRDKAHVKFDRASEMLFTREALEQASSQRLAEYHASRFPEGQKVADLTAGIGSDLIALARRGPAIGYEIDPERAECAQANLAVYGVSAEIRVKDCMAGRWDFDYAFADPARRVDGERTLDPALFSPPPDHLAIRFDDLKLGGMKLGPAMSDHRLESIGPRLEFLSFGGECREALVWRGSEASSGRVAVHVESGEALAVGSSAPSAEEPGEFLFDVDPAAVRAHALGTLCQLHGLRQLGDARGYLTGSELATSVWLRAFRVLASGRFDERTLRALLRSWHSAAPVLRQSGTRLDLIALARRLTRAGDRPLELAFWPLGRSVRFSLLEAYTEKGS